MISVSFLLFNFLCVLLFLKSYLLYFMSYELIFLHCADRCSQKAMQLNTEFEYYKCLSTSNILLVLVVALEISKGKM